MLFYQCTNLVSVEIPNSVTSIGSNAFYGCTALTNIPDLSGITIIPNGLFLECTSLVSVTIPNSITSVGGSSFQRCTNLRDIVIPSSVTNMSGQFTFAECRSLVSCTIEAITPPTILSNNYMFEGVYTNFKIYVPATSVDTYKSVTGWSQYAAKIQPIPT